MAAYSQAPAMSNGFRPVWTGLQAQLVSLLLMVSLIPLLFVAFLAYSTGQNTLQESVGRDLAELAAEKVKQADKLIQHRINLIQSQAQEDGIRGLLGRVSEDASVDLYARWQQSGAVAPSAQLLVDRLASAAGESSQVTLSDARCQTIASHNVPEIDFLLREHETKKLRMGGSGQGRLIGSPAILEDSEQVFLEARTLTRGVDYEIDYPSATLTLLGEFPANTEFEIDFDTRPEWFRLTYQNGQGTELFAEDVFYDESQRLHLLPLTVPVYSKENTDLIVGILRVVFPLPELAELVMTSEEEPTEVFLVDNHSRAVAVSRDGDYAFSDRLADSKISASVFEVVLAAQGTILPEEGRGYALDEDGQEVIGWSLTRHWLNEDGETKRYFRRSDGEPRNFASWSAHVAKPTKHAFEAARQLRSKILLFTLASCMVVIPIVLLFTRKIVTPLRDLTAAARVIGDGDFEHPIEPKDTSNEIGILAEEFNAMRLSLQSADDRLKREARKMTAIVNSLAEGLIVLGPKHRIIHVNPVAEDMLGIQGDVAGMGIHEAIPNEQLRSVLEQGLSKLEDQDFISHEVVLEDNETVLRVLASVLQDEDGSALGMVYVLEDITEQKAIDKMKSDFIGLVSHELRTPLTSIIGFVSFILDGKAGPINDRQRNSLERVERQSKRLAALISDLLDVSRIESGRIQMEREPVPLGQVVRHRIEEIRPQAESKKIVIDTQLPEDLPTVVGDEARLGQVVTNLVGNAIKFTPENGRITIKLSREGSLVRAQFIDTGPGIPEDEQSKIFDKFYQVSDIHTRQQGGSGLGLAITKSIIEAHGGMIWLRSTAGRGSNFQFALPISGATEQVNPNSLSTVNS